MAEEKSDCCQVTINVSGGGVKINDGAQATDLTKYVTREVADSIYAPRTQVAAMGDSIRAARAVADAALTKATADEAYATKSQVSSMGDSIRATRSAAEQTKADGEDTKRIAEHAESLTQTLAKNLAVFPRVLRLDAGQPVPDGTPLGTVIVRTAEPISHSANLFPPIGEWPKINAAETGDGVRLDFQHQILSTGLEQLRPSGGKWHMTLRYSFPGGNFGEETGQANLYTVRRFQEEGHPAQADQGAKVATLEVVKGEHLVLELDIEPLQVDPHVGDTWGVWLEAPIPTLYVHDLVIRKVA